ncbi:hypothetical protein [Gordonia sputi]|uniref:Uncharacterized protein n=1 Tax=Gordonia sputi NBRC 100414 TaxID=1089453 RepID=H5TWA8_9ACTN|nr:hypothetical protein [Gordonia sputi]GAB37766.1 hypothetical protein GOSPT_022_01100 [Gordonia sputi NBRC 100414]
MLAGVLGGVEDEGGVVVGGVVVGGVVGGVVVVGAVVDGVVTDGADVPTSAWAPPTPRDRHAATTATVLENERKYVTVRMSGLVFSPTRFGSLCDPRCLMSPNREGDC